MRTLAIASLIILAAGPVAAATAPDQASTKSVTHHAKASARSASSKPDSQAKKTKMPDPDAGVNDQGMPNAATTNGGEMKR
jgi:hypothetical protein